MEWQAAHSTSLDPQIALRQAAAKIRDAFGGGEADFAILVASSSYGDGLESLPALACDLLGTETVVGCSSYVPIAGGEELTAPSVALLCGRGDLKPLLHVDDLRDLPDSDGSPSHWRQRLGMPLSQGSLIFADPYSPPGVEDFLEGLGYAWPGAALAGGFASGDPGRCAVFAGRRCLRRSLVLLSFPEEVMRSTYCLGCRPFGPVYRVTSCQGPLLRALDDRRPVELLRELSDTLPHRDRELMRQSLFIGIESEAFGDDEDEIWLPRALRGVEAGSGALLIGENLPQGCRVRFLLRDPSTRLPTLADALAQKHPSALVLSSCLSRAGHDGDAFTLARLLPGTPHIGFHASGEITRVRQSPRLLGMSAVCALFE